MIFTNEELKSKYEFDYELDGDETILDLAKELYRITDIIHNLIKQETIYTFHLDINDHKIYLDYSLIKTNVFNRDINEIRQLLIRDNKSIKHSLEELNIKIDESNNDYLQLYYFIYICNYFIFPNTNFFVLFKHNNFLNSFENNIYINFIMSNLFDKKECFYDYLEMCSELDAINYDADVLINKGLREEKVNYDDLMIIINNINIINDHFNSNIITVLIEYLHAYSMRIYAFNILNNLNNDHDIFKFNLDIPLFDNWKTLYIDLDDIDSFIKDPQLIQFIKGKYFKVESRDIHKFIDSKGVKFLFKILDYDKEWYNLYKQGLFIEDKDNKLCIYGAKLAIIVKTYNLLVNKIKLNINNDNHTLLLNSMLNYNLYSYSTLPVRLFYLASTSLYLNATSDNENYYDYFLLDWFYPELIYNELVLRVFSYDCFDDWYQYLLKFNNVLDS